MGAFVKGIMQTFADCIIWLLIKKVRNCITIIDSPMVHLFWPLKATIILPKYSYGTITNKPLFHNNGPSCSSFESVIPFDGVYLLTLFVGVCEKWTLGLEWSSMWPPNLIWFDLIWWNLFNLLESICGHFLLVFVKNGL